MGLFDWVMNGIGFQEEADEEIPEIESTEKPKKKRRGLFGRKKKNEFEFNDIQPSTGFDFDQFNAMKEEDEGTATIGGYTNSYSGFGGGSSYSNKNFVFFSPTNYEEIKKLVEYLKQGEPAIVNFDKISDLEAQRSLDFISGAACALGGKLQRITGNFFLVTPDGYNITKPAGQDM